MVTVAQRWDEWLDLVSGLAAHPSPTFAACFGEDVRSTTMETGDAASGSNSVVDYILAFAGAETRQ